MTKKVQLNNILLVPDVNLSTTYATKTQMSFEYFNCCQARLLDFIDLEDSLITVSFLFGTLESLERIEVNLSEKSYKKSISDYLSKEFCEVTRVKLTEKISE